MNPLTHLAGTELETIAAFVLLPVMVALCIMAVSDWSRHRGNSYKRRSRTARRPLAGALERRP